MMLLLQPPDYPCHWISFCHRRISAHLPMPASTCPQSAWSCGTNHGRKCGLSVIPAYGWEFSLWPVPTNKGTKPPKETPVEFSAFAYALHKLQENFTQTHTHTHTRKRGPGKFHYCPWHLSLANRCAGSLERILFVPGPDSSRYYLFFFCCFCFGGWLWCVERYAPLQPNKKPAKHHRHKKKTEHKQNTNKNYQAIYLIFFPVFGFLVKNGLVFFFFLAC